VIQKAHIIIPLPNIDVRPDVPKSAILLLGFLDYGIRPNRCPKPTNDSTLTNSQGSFGWDQPIVPHYRHSLCNQWAISLPLAR
jgi:hypothetical protein